MTLREVIEDVVKEWWGAPQGQAIVKSGTSGLVNTIEHHVMVWVIDRDCRLEQIIALVKANMNPCLRKGSFGQEKRLQILGGEQVEPGWNLQLSPEAGHLIDFDGATLKDVLQEACDKYLSKEQRHEVS